MEPEKIRKKIIKTVVFLFISFLIANTFLAYIIGNKALIKIITRTGYPALGWLYEHLGFYGDILPSFTAGSREQVCTLFCPYGRLQGVMIDEHTLVVAYDDVRGEPRGKLDRKAVLPGLKGDCVDCGLCVDVCPTGMDIRKGTQLECINCTACIDVCNEVMDKIHKPRNLIGFFSENMIREKEKPSFTGRMMAYSAVIAVLVGVLSYFIFSRSDMDVTIMRGPGYAIPGTAGGVISAIFITPRSLNKNQ